MNFFRISTLWVPDHHLNMEWDHPERPALKEWSIKAFDGNLRLSALFGVAVFAPILLLMFFVLEMGWVINSILAVIAWFVFSNTALQKRVCVNRLSEKGGEVYKWRAIPNFIFASMPWLAGIYLALVLWGFTISSAVGLGALMGGGGLGILYIAVFTSKDYKKDQLDVRHWKFDWDEIYEAIYDRKGHAIGFNVERSKPYIARFKEENENFYSCQLYFHPKMAEELLLLFKSKIKSGVEIKEGRIHYRTID